MPNPARCPSCGRPIDRPGACPACGFTASLSAGAAAGPAAERVARLGVGSGAVAWAPTAPTPPPSITAPPVVSPPPSQISVDGLEARWTSRLPTRRVRAAVAAAGAAATAARTPVSAGPAGPDQPFEHVLSPGVAEAAARARERRRELTGAPGPTARPPAGFDQVVISDWRGDQAGPAFDQVTSSDWTASAQTPPTYPTRPRSTNAVRDVSRTPLRPADSSPPYRPSWMPPSGAWRMRVRELAGRGRATAIGVLIAIVLAVILLNVVGVGDQGFQSGGQGPASDYTITVSPPDQIDLQTARGLFGTLVVVRRSVASSGSTTQPPPGAIAKVRLVRATLIMWRDGFELSPHQTAVVDRAIAYAGALRLELKAPRSAAARRAAQRAWRAWRSDDPMMFGS